MALEFRFRPLKFAWAALRERLSIPPGTWIKDRHVIAPNDALTTGAMRVSSPLGMC